MVFYACLFSQRHTLTQMAGIQEDSHKNKRFSQMIVNKNKYK